MKSEARILVPLNLRIYIFETKLFCQTLSPRGKKTIQKENKINSMSRYENVGMCY